jgi:CHASE3 domain sensor protein
MKLIKNPYLIVAQLSGIIVIILAIFLYNIKQKNSSRDLVENLNSVINNCNSLLLASVNHQMGIRGYLITQNKNFLEPYYASLPVTEKHLTDLELLSKDNLKLQNRLETLGILISQRIELSNKIILHKEQPVNTNQNLSFVEEGKIIGDKTQALIEKIVEEATKTLAEKKAIEANIDKK